MIPQHQLAKTRDDLTWLAAHDAFHGIAETIAERRRQVEQLGYDAAHDDLHDGSHSESLLFLAKGRLGFGELHRAAALIAAEIDRERRAGYEP